MNKNFHASWGQHHHQQQQRSSSNDNNSYQYDETLVGGDGTSIVPPSSSRELKTTTIITTTSSSNGKVGSVTKNSQKKVPSSSTSSSSIRSGTSSNNHNNPSTKSNNSNLRKNSTNASMTNMILERERDGSAATNTIHVGTKDVEIPTSSSYTFFGSGRGGGGTCSSSTQNKPNPNIDIVVDGVNESGYDTRRERRLSCPPIQALDSAVEMTDFFRHVFEWTWPTSTKGGTSNSTKDDEKNMKKGSNTSPTHEQNNNRDDMENSSYLPSLIEDLPSNTTVSFVMASPVIDTRRIHNDNTDKHVMNQHTETSSSSSMKSSSSHHKKQGSKNVSSSVSNMLSTKRLDGMIDTMTCGDTVGASIICPRSSERDRSTENDDSMVGGISNILLCSEQTANLGTCFEDNDDADDRDVHDRSQQRSSSRRKKYNHRSNKKNENDSNSGGGGMSSTSTTYSDVDSTRLPPTTIWYSPSTSDTSDDEEDDTNHENNKNNHPSRHLQNNNNHNNNSGGVSITASAAAADSRFRHSAWIARKFYQKQQKKLRKDSASNPFARREGKSLSWRQVNMKIKSRSKDEVVILDDVWGVVPKRETTAIMGASGAGKTTLLNILAGRVRSNGSIKITADVRLNSYSVNPTNIKIRKSIAFVAQDDSLHATTTPREALRFSARLRLQRKINDTQIETLVTHMIEELGLVSCADTIVGGPLIKGISGGERKRTSVGLELVVRPSMVFLDEPTSGLDAFSAIQICQVLKKVANAGASVLFTIHQPSSDIFRSFDHLILLQKGRVLYQGSVKTIPSYYAERGFPIPNHFNPADWVINIAQQYSMETLEKAGFFEGMDQTYYHSEPLVPRPGEDFIGRKLKKNRLLKAERPASLMKQVSLLFTRELVHMYRFQLPIQARLGVTAFLSTLIGAMFYKVGEADKTDPFNLQSHFGGVMICLFFSLLGSAQPAIVFFPEERPIFLREYSTEHYSVTAYFLSRLFFEAFVTGVQVLLMIAILYNMLAFKGSVFILYGATYALALSGTAIAVCIGVVAKGNAKTAQQLVPVVLMPQLLFSGFFVTPSLMPGFLRWLQYGCTLTFAMRIVTVEEFTHCSDNFFEQQHCTMLLNNIEAKAEDVTFYWIMLVTMFFAFRLLALFMLQRSATVFY